MESMGQIIQRYRKKQRISQSELAAHLQISVQAVSKWETGKANPDVMLLPKLAKLLGVNVDALFPGEEEAPSYGETLAFNHSGWNQVAETTWNGTYLPEYGPYTPSEETLCLLGDVRGKAVLELACGGGESLQWMARHGVKELWGLDLSQTRIDQARQRLRSCPQPTHLVCGAMEQNAGFPQGYFDLVYSIYGLGWTMDLDATLTRVAEYLKPGGTFVFSWDNPLLQCVEARGGAYRLTRSYTEEPEIAMEKAGAGLRIRNWKLSSYLNALADHGFLLQHMVEESAYDPKEAEVFQEGKYYSPGKASLLNLSVILKAKKL